MSIDITRDGAVAVVVVNRPDAMNALDPPTLAELGDRLLEVRDDPEARAVVLTGAGGRAFVAGADIKAMRAMDVQRARVWGEQGHHVAELLETMPKPTIAAIDGFALGGGCELALACDLRYASPKAQIGQPEIELGLIPGWGGTQRLARVCGLGFAKELVLTGRMIDAEEALGRGLVNEIADPVLDRALEVARTLATKSPLALAAAKAATNHALQGDHAVSLAREAKLFGGLFASEDAREGMAAFLERRKPTFTGR